MAAIVASKVKRQRKQLAEAAAAAATLTSHSATTKLRVGNGGLSASSILERRSLVKV